MSEVRKIQQNLSVQDYLDGELHSETRHEYIDGQVYAMAGATRKHNQIAGNLFADLQRALEGGPCQTYIGDVKIRVHHLGLDSFYYPDVVIGCDPTDDHDLYLEKPSSIFEVLSESTERIDRQEKFHACRSLPCLMEYVLVSQERMEVTLARRDNDWQAEIVSGDDATLVLPSLGQSLALSRIYRHIDLDK